MYSITVIGESGDTLTALVSLVVIVKDMTQTLKITLMTLEVAGIHMEEVRELQNQKYVTA